MKVKELIDSKYVKESIHLDENMDIKGIGYHSGEIRDGYLFVAIKGYITDGHKYIRQAIDNGAILAVVEEFVDEDIAQIKVDNSRKVLSSISAKFYKEPSKDIRTIGVTATNGKTTTTFMLNQIYEEAGFKTGIVGSVLNKVGEDYAPAYLTTPESLDLHRLFNRMREEKVERIIMEASSSALELYRVNDVDFDIVSFNNFSREHIDQHGSYENYWKYKSSLIRGVKEEGIAILNMDDSKISTLYKSKNKNMIPFTIKDKRGLIYCENIQLEMGRANFDVVIKKDIDLLNGKIKRDKFHITLGIPGLHSLENAMMAIVIALADNIPSKVIIKALKEFKGVERRFEYIYEDDFLIIDDHFANVKNINITLETLSKIPRNRLHIVYAIRGNRGITVNRENAEALVSWKDKLDLKEIIATRSIGSVTDKDKVSEEEERVFREIINESGLRLHLFDSLEAAIKYSLKDIQSNDVVLLAGCQGMDYGGEIALNYINEIRDDIDEDKLFATLRRRVVGS